jgi:hypothetical protein
MAHLWPLEWFDITDGESALRNISRVWKKKGYETLTENDYARMEPFLEPFDGIYTDQEIVILSRIGNNGVQKEFCSMFLQPPVEGSAENDGVWVLEWYLDKDDIRRIYLRQVAQILYGAQLENDETQCMILLTHALSNLRRLRITIKGEQILGEFDDLEGIPEAQEAVMENSFENPVLDIEEVSVESEDYFDDEDENDQDSINSGESSQ